MKELGKRVLLSRRDLGIEQGELAERVRVSQSYISRLEHGKAKTISVEVIHALAHALGVSAGYLIGDSDDPTGDAMAIVEDGAVVGELFEQLTPWQQVLMLEVMRDMSGESARADDLTRYERMISHAFDELEKIGGSNLVSEAIRYLEAKAPTRRRPMRPASRSANLAQEDE